MDAKVCICSSDKRADPTTGGGGMEVDGPSELEASSGNKLTVVHRHGPCSPIINTRQKLNHRQILHHDQARVISLHNRISAASRKDKSTGVTETLTLTPSNVLTNFEFGCGEKNKGLFGSVAGLVGLGRGEVSLASQAAQEYGGVFSYCLPPRVSSTGYLTLGASGPAPNVRFTPMLTNPAKPSFYYVELIGLSVGGKNLSIPPSTFTDTGTIIDSGTVITYLPSSGYSALRDEFRRQMANYSMAPPLPMLDTCYNFTGVGSISLPSDGLRFSGGVTLDVDPSGILHPASISQACLAFFGNSDPSSISIIGNTVQRTYDIVYDVARGVGGGLRGRVNVGRGLEGRYLFLIRFIHKLHLLRSLMELISQSGMNKSSFT
ncbi:aspartyl protease family protein At5g10770-like [Phoenix dactylifera]|uniref:Aspartyl protease family protein At5g10770-like n=1 Tax=Phoenix dactylifera TaxID=42345 RepID=A0A8B8ZHJ9_PHODC|nr:aspartyl protease family protein At5g10770-like [Phoenix dactylifera]